MKTIGIIGGLSWHSTSLYYKIINEQVHQRLGGSASAKLLIYSVDFSEFNALQKAGDWDTIACMLTDIARRLISAGADAILIASNTPHMIADQLIAAIDKPFIHIAVETARAIEKMQLSKVGLLGTKFTMEQSFFKEKLSHFNIEALTPGQDDRNDIHDSIFNELSCGIYKEETKQHYLKIIDELKSRHIQGIVFGCSEICLLIDPFSLGIPVFDTTQIHALSAVQFALK
jgi:aspartate racemase